jgi:hypothetical protein
LSHLAAGGALDIKVFPRRAIISAAAIAPTTVAAATALALAFGRSAAGLTLFGVLKPFGLIELLLLDGEREFNAAGGALQVSFG